MLFLVRIDEYSLNAFERRSSGREATKQMSS